MAVSCGWRGASFLATVLLASSGVTGCASGPVGVEVALPAPPPIAAGQTVKAPVHDEPGDGPVLPGPAEELKRWADFPVEANPRPLVLKWLVVDTPEGFNSGALKQDFAHGRWAIPDDLPSAPAEFDGYPVIGARRALQLLRGAEGGAGRGGRSELAVSDVHLGKALIASDRGPRRLPAWFVSFRGARGQSVVAAVAPEARWTGGESPTRTSDLRVTVDPSGRLLTLPYPSGPPSPTPCSISYEVRVAESAQAVALQAIPTRQPSPPDNPVTGVRGTCSMTTAARGDGGATTVVRLAMPLGNRLVVQEGAVVTVLAR